MISFCEAFGCHHVYLSKEDEVGTFCSTCGKIIKR